MLTLLANSLQIFFGLAITNPYVIHTNVTALYMWENEDQLKISVLITEIDT